MPCYKPLHGYRSKTVNDSGKRSIVFNRNQGYADQEVTLPCGRCIGCRLERSRQWAVRCMHEASLHENNCFITLTYNQDNLPEDGSLKLRHFQLFIKKLREKFNLYKTDEDPGLRYFHCGEYGQVCKECGLSKPRHRISDHKFEAGIGRPHYHACLFNFDFKDKEFLKIKNMNTYYTSKALEELWGKGFCVIGDVTFESAAYVARYITKKITGDMALDHYNVIDNETGEILQERKEEYTTMSRNPGIAKGWFEKYHTDVYPSDQLIVKGVPTKPPKYYDAQYEVMNMERYLQVKKRRKDSALKKADDNHLGRLYDKEYVKKRQTINLNRSYENE